MKPAFPIVIVLAALSIVNAQAQDPVKTFPENYRVAFENAFAAVIKVRYGPHEKIGVHDHPKTPTVYVYLNDSGGVRYKHFGEAAFTITRPPTTKGSYRVSPGRIERHSIENLADTPSEFLRVELKQAPLGSLPHFRGTAPAHLLQSVDRVEIKDDKGFEIHRVICVGASACTLEASTRPSLLVAFSPLTITSGTSGSSPRQLKDGAVEWLNAEQAATVIPASASPAHLIRIIIPVHP